MGGRVPPEGPLVGAVRLIRAARLIRLSSGTAAVWQLGQRCFGCCSSALRLGEERLQRGDVLLDLAPVIAAEGDGEVGDLPARTGLAHGRTGLGSRGAPGGTASLRTSIRWVPTPMVVSTRLYRMAARSCCNPCACWSSAERITGVETT